METRNKRKREAIDISLKDTDTGNGNANSNERDGTRAPNAVRPKARHIANDNTNANTKHPNVNPVNDRAGIQRSNVREKVTTRSLRSTKTAIDISLKDTDTGNGNANSNERDGTRAPNAIRPMVRHIANDNTNANTKHSNVNLFNGKTGASTNVSNENTVVLKRVFVRLKCLTKTEIDAATKGTHTKSDKSVAIASVMNETPGILKNVTIRLSNLTKTQIDAATKSIGNDNDNEHDGKEAQIASCSQNDSPGSTPRILTRAQKRKRECISNIPLTNEPKTKTKIHKQNRARVKNLSLKEKINKNAPSNEYMTNEIILATIPGFCAWPARIINISHETITVEFFGTGQINPVRSTAVTRFELNKVIPFLERKGFQKAMQELELVLQIPTHISLYKQ